MDLKDKKIMVIGGAGLVGSHIVDQLIDEPVSEILVFDNFVRGSTSNLEYAVKDPRVKVIEASMTDFECLEKSMNGVDGVFQLASLWLGECLNDPRSA
ncbi:MAG TPA: NAD-dependent epimerase/dehydratase family protein, partial [Pelolinea sp.]|nr:NAD-dependent epimerase/dehydratase family protein [Pelolinea sp.]